MVWNLFLLALHWQPDCVTYWLPPILFLFERFRRLFHHSAYKALLGHKGRNILSSLWVEEDRFKQRVWVEGTRPEEEEIFQSTMVQVCWTHADTGQWRDQAAGEHVFAANYGAVLLSDHPFLSFDDCLFLSLLFYVSGGFCVVAFWSARVLATYDGLKCIVFTVQNWDRWAAMNIFVVMCFTVTGKAT